jgi:hypothetical protein
MNLPERGHRAIAVIGSWKPLDHTANESGRPAVFADALPERGKSVVERRRYLRNAAAWPR